LFFSTLISQLLAPDAVTITREPGDTETVLLAFPSAERTVTVIPFPLFPPPPVCAETLPLPAVTLVDKPPALEVPEIADPVVELELFSTVQPPELDDDDALVLAARDAVAGTRRNTAASPAIAFVI
jgi:hypothetical protein